MGPLQELGVGTGEIFDAIAGLVDKSLIATRIDETQAQYRLLDTARACALEKLEEHAEVNVVFRRHAEYVAGYLDELRCSLWQRPKKPQPVPIHRHIFAQRRVGALGRAPIPTPRWDSPPLHAQ